MFLFVFRSLSVVPVNNMFNGVNEGDYDNLWLGEQDEEFNKVSANFKQNHSICYYF